MAVFPLERVCRRPLFAPAARRVVSVLAADGPTLASPPYASQQHGPNGHARLPYGAGCSSVSIWARCSLPE
jgi:hypothetical protein